MKLIEQAINYQPTKTAMAWTAAGAGVLTVILGFTVGGWVTGGTAAKMAKSERAAAVSEVTAAYCAQNFAAVGTVDQHDEITSLSSFRQRQFIERQDWALLPGMTSISRVAAEDCARAIIAMDPAVLVTTVAAAADDTEAG